MRARRNREPIPRKITAHQNGVDFFASQKQDAPTKLAYAIIVLPRAPHNAPSRTFHTLNTPNSANPTLQQAARLMTLPRVPLHTPHLRMRAGATLCAPRAPRGAKTPPFVALPAPKQAVAPPSSNGRRIVFQVEVTHTPSTDVPFPNGTRFNNNRIFGPSNGQRTRRATRAWRHLGDQAEKKQQKNKNKKNMTHTKPQRPTPQP